VQFSQFFLSSLVKLRGPVPDEEKSDGIYKISRGEVDSLCISRSGHKFRVRLCQHRKAFHHHDENESAFASPFLYRRVTALIRARVNFSTLMVRAGFWIVCKKRIYGMGSTLLTMYTLTSSTPLSDSVTHSFSVLLIGFTFSSVSWVPDDDRRRPIEASRNNKFRASNHIIELNWSWSTESFSVLESWSCVPVIVFFFFIRLWSCSCWLTESIFFPAYSCGCG